MIFKYLPRKVKPYSYLIPDVIVTTDVDQIEAEWQSRSPEDRAQAQQEYDEEQSRLRDEAESAPTETLPPRDERLAWAVASTIDRQAISEALGEPSAIDPPPPPSEFDLYMPASLLSLLNVEGGWL